MADNYFRLMCLAVNVCPEPLRDLFMKLAKSDSTRPYIELSAYISCRMPEIMQLKTTGALSERQFNSIFQRGGNSDRCHWDILSLVTLIKAFFSGQLLQEVNIAMDELRQICGELQQIPYGSEIDETDFHSYCGRIIPALKTLAKQVHGKEYETEIRDKIKEALYAPGRSFTDTFKNQEGRITSIEEYLKQWNENQTIILQSLQKKIDELKTNSKTVAADSKASSSLLRSVTVTKNWPTGKKMKRLKTVDNILYRLIKLFRLTMQTELSDHFIPPTEISEIRTKLNDIHHVIVTGGNNNKYLETALFAIKDLRYNLERCVELYDASDWRHIDSDDVDLVLIRDPFGNTFYDDRKAKSMLDIFDSILHTIKSVDIIIVTDVECLSKAKERYDHVLLEEVVQLIGETSESHPIDLTSVTHEWDSPMRTQPHFTRQITEIYLDRYLNESRQIGQDTIHEAKDIMKKNKMLLIAGPPESGKTVLAVALASSYAREEVLLLCSPDGIGTLDLQRTSLVIIDDFVGNYMFDRKNVSEWYSVFDQLHIAVTAGKLNVILICESGKLQQCIEEVGKHPMMSNQLMLTIRPVSIKQESLGDVDPDILKSMVFQTVNEGRHGEAEAALDKHDNLYDAEETVDSLESTYWHIDNSVWEATRTTPCAENEAKRFLTTGKLPDGNVFQQVCSTYGRHSELVKDICKTVCSYIGSFSDQIVDVWPAYLTQKGLESTGSDDLIFVVITENEDDQWRDDLNYKIYQRKRYECSEESTVVNRKEQNEECMCNYTEDIMSRINENAESLLKKHSNITMISASCMKSIGFGTENADLQKRHCIVLYTHVKGHVPLYEEPFPTSISGYPVDVREAVFRPFGNGPTDHHNSIKMGCAIRNGMIDEQGQCFIGTIGGFLQHPKYGLCCTTAAHVLIGDLNNIPECSNGYRKLMQNDQSYPVFQPVSLGARSFGNLVEAIYYEGSVFEAGVDVALIQITDRHPEDGVFPESNSNEENGFSAEEPMIYRNGKICARSNLRKGNIVLKYGSSTEVTRGVFRTRGASVRQATTIGTLRNNFNFLLRNQIEILHVGNKPFADYGDSGALVFMEENKELIAIGVVEGGMGNGIYIVSPINDVLRALEMPEGSTMKSFDEVRVRGLNESDEPLNTSISLTSSSCPSLSKNSSMNESGYSSSSSDSNGMLVSFEGLKAINEDFTKKLERQSAAIRQEINTFKEDFKEELRQLQKAQLEEIAKMLAPPINK